jgi:hypothetical protein
VTLQRLKPDLQRALILAFGEKRDPLAISPIERKLTNRLSLSNVSTAPHAIVALRVAQLRQHARV